jgi:UDPglucose 6-dehydrogenase
METTIGFIGQGWIGRNLADNFERRGYKTIRYAKEAPYDKNLEQLKHADIIFIAVPTPTSPDGFDDRILRSAIKEASPGQTVVIKSTILPGTTDSIAKENPDIFVMHAPEFLREASVKRDIEKPERNIIGIPAAHIDDPKWRKRAEAVLAVVPNAPYEIICTAAEAELTKYGGNNFFYMKVVYMNMLYDLAKEHGASWDTIAANLVPGRGAGGHCFIKDFAALRFHYEEKFPEHAHMHSLLRTFEATNNYLLRSTKKDEDLLRAVYGEEVLCVCKVNDASASCVCGVNV